MDQKHFMNRNNLCLSKIIERSGLPPISCHQRWPNSEKWVFVQKIGNQTDIDAWALLPLEGMLSAWHSPTRESMDIWSAGTQGGSAARIWSPAVIMRVSIEKPPTLEKPQLWAGAVRVGRLMLDPDSAAQCWKADLLRKARLRERATRFVPGLQAFSVVLQLWGSWCQSSHTLLRTFQSAFLCLQWGQLWPSW